MIDDSPSALACSGVPMNIAANEPEANPCDIAGDHDLRSLFMRRLLAVGKNSMPTAAGQSPPRLLVQFWDDASAIPQDVQDCMNSWAVLERGGFQRLLFDDVTALKFIEEQFGSRQSLAFKMCQHPAMRSDYFRLCFVLKMGGFYVDADDVYLGTSIDILFADGRLKVQPLCYDIPSDSMLDPLTTAINDGCTARIFYVNNNPLIAPPGHPVIASALDHATSVLLSAHADSRDIQSLTGPGNFTAALVRHAVELERADLVPDFSLLNDWGSMARSEWPLAYRSDDRNWRNWVRGDG